MAKFPQSNLLQSVSWDNSDFFFFMNNISRSFTLFAILAFAFYLYVFCFLSFAFCDWFLVTDVFVWKLFCLYHLSYFVLWWLFWCYIFCIIIFYLLCLLRIFLLFFYLVSPISLSASYFVHFLSYLVFIFSKSCLTNILMCKLFLHYLLYLIVFFFLNLVSPTSLCANYFVHYILYLVFILSQYCLTNIFMCKTYWCQHRVRFCQVKTRLGKKRSKWLLEITT